jgi:bacteriocin-type signal sequence
MKTNYFKKSKENINSTLIEMNKEELKSVQGGVTAYVYVNPDGTYRVVIKND